MLTNVVFDEAEYQAMRDHERRRSEFVKHVHYEPTDGPKSMRWSAYDGRNYDDGDPIGLGPTQEDALLDLLEQMDL